MNLQQTKIILEKINTLHKTISLDAGNVSAIERDLMLTYVRQLYDALLHESNNRTTTSTVVERPTVVHTPPTVITKDIPVATEKIVTETPVTKTTRKKPRVVEVPDSIKEYAKPPVAGTPPPAKPELLEKHTSSAQPKKEHDALFEQQEAKELSDKLSTLPVRDLTKAMGLNEKILTINELFGGDHRAFDDAIKDLNNMAGFDDAKAYMSENLAEKYNWSAKSKKKKAQIFIKLVSRRYK